MKVHAIRSNDEPSILSTKKPHQNKEKTHSYQVQSVFYSQTLAVCVRFVLHLCQLLGERKYRNIICIKASDNIPHYTTSPHPYYLLNPTIPSGTLYSSVITDLMRILNQTKDNNHSETKPALHLCITSH